jgi:hypothetical protein
VLDFLKKRMVIEILLNKKIQTKFYSNEFTFFKGKKNVYIIENKLTVTF